MSRRDVREWYGYAFGLPDRHPAGFSRGAVRCPCVVRASLCGCAWARGAWWFENWIVDASEAEAVGLRFASIVFRSNFI